MSAELFGVKITHDRSCGLWILVIDWSPWVFLLEPVKKYKFTAYDVIKNILETLNTVLRVV